MRDRVVVEIEAHVRRLAGRHRLDLVGREGISRQRQQALSLLGECLTDRQRFVLRAAALAGATEHPRIGLRIEVIQIVERAAGEEGIADIADRPLHAPLLVAPRHGHRAGIVMVVAGQSQQRRMEANDVAAAFKHGALEIVVERDTRATTPGGDGADMAAQEILHVGAEVEAQKYLARPRQHGDEPHQGPVGATYLQVTEVTPVDLHLFTGQGAQTQIRFRLRARPVMGDQVAKVIRASGVASILDHVVQAAGAQARELRQGLQDKRQVGIDCTGPANGAQVRQAGLCQDTGNAIAMHLQLGGNGANGPAFGVMVAQDLRFSFGGKGHACSCRGGFGESDGAGSLDARIPGGVDGRNDNAKALRSRISSLSVRPSVEQEAMSAGNPDASLSFAWRDIDAGARRGHDGRDACLDNAGRLHAVSCGEPATHILRCSNDGLDHSGRRSARRCGNRRTGSVFREGPLAVRANGQRTQTCAS